MKNPFKRQGQTERLNEEFEKEFKILTASEALNISKIKEPEYLESEAKSKQQMIDWYLSDVMRDIKIQAEKGCRFSSLKGCGNYLPYVKVKLLELGYKTEDGKLNNVETKDLFVVW